MSITIFEQNLESNVMKVIGSYFDANNIECKIARGEDNQIITLPLIVVHAVDGEEAVFQTANYRVKLSATVRVDLDSGSPSQSAQLFGAVMDVFQDTDLMTQLNNLGGIFLKGMVLLDQSIEDTGDREWKKTISMDFFGYAIA